MNPLRLSMLVVAVLIGGALSASCVDGTTCSAATCPSGCCSTKGVCEDGNTVDACGRPATTCSVCTNGATCSDRLCTGGHVSTGGGTAAGGGTADAGGVNPALQFVRDREEAYCQHSLPCLGQGLTSLTECRAAAVASDVSTATAITRGQFIFSAAAATSCLTAYRNSSCANGGGIFFDGAFDSCEHVLIGATALGARCDDPLSCQQGLACAGATCPSTCVATGALGQPCNQFTCNSGLWCEQQSDTLGTCRAPGAVGDTCNQSISNSCDADHLCDALTRTCQPLPKEGHACTSALLCAGDSFCNADALCEARIAPGGQCQGADCRLGYSCQHDTCQPAIGAGQPCANSQQCGADMRCDAVTHTCLAPRAAPSGESCTGDAVYCASDLHNCQGASASTDGGVATLGLCLPAHVGDPCTSRFDCPAATYCSANTQFPVGSCRVADVGTDCVSNRQCRITEYCADGLCESRVVTGEVCDDTSQNDPCANLADECVSTLDAPSEFRCTPRGTADADCTDDRACAWGLACVNDVCVPSGPTGVGCIDDAFCSSGQCVVTAGVRRCGPPVDAGSSCQFNADCVSRYCDVINGRCAAACE